MHDSAAQQFVKDVREELGCGGPTDTALLAVLDRVLARYDCPPGTIPALDPATGLLRLRAQRGIPGHLLERVERVPIGKGMAGIAAERRQPVQVCNLQTDRSGAAKPMARETRVEGAIAVPMLVGERLSGVLGVAKPVTYEFGQAEISQLLEIGSLIANQLDATVTNGS